MISDLNSTNDAVTIKTPDGKLFESIRQLRDAFLELTCARAVDR
jgi:hypothetical protein